MKNNQSNFRKFLLLWLGELISSIGGGLTSFGLGVYVFRQTGSAASMAFITLLAFLPTLLLSVPAGVLADRYDRRLLMMLGDGLSALGIIYILICMFQGEASVTQIGIGVFISAVFSALLEPAYRATVSDLLTKEEFSKASGMVSIAGSARYLISPLIAGLLLSVSEVKLLLVIDIATFVLTVIATSVVKKGIAVNQDDKEKPSFTTSMKEGFKAICAKKGLLSLIFIASVMTCFMGTFQILAEPLILSFADSLTLGTAETVCASGMLAASVFLGLFGIKKNYVRTLIISLSAAGAAMVVFGLKENLVLLCTSGFLFFAMLPFANNCLDYLVRTNTDVKFQGRVWGVIGFLSQIGYVVAYGLAGILSDKIASYRQISVGRGASYVIMGAGVLLVITALSIIPQGAIRRLEQNQEQ